MPIFLYQVSCPYERLCVLHWFAKPCPEPQTSSGLEGPSFFNQQRQSSQREHREMFFSFNILA